MTKKREFDARTEAIAALNDRLRQFFIGGQVLMTIGVDSLSSTTKSKIIEAIQNMTIGKMEMIPMAKGILVVSKSTAKKSFSKLTPTTSIWRWAHPTQPIRPSPGAL